MGAATLETVVLEERVPAEYSNVLKEDKVGGSPDELGQGRLKVTLMEELDKGTLEHVDYSRMVKEDGGMTMGHALVGM